MVMAVKPKLGTNSDSEVVMLFDDNDNNDNSNSKNYNDKNDNNNNVLLNTFYSTRIYYIYSF